MEITGTPASILRLRDLSFDLSLRTYVMGILNVTPDSFSDGGKFISFKDALNHAEKMHKDGADIIDVGGESTRPGAEPVSLDEEERRVLPVVKELEKSGIPVSVDTYKYSIAEKALDCGAHMVNDITGLRTSPEIARLAKEHSVPLVIMHMKGTPRTMQENPTYGNLIGEVSDFFKERIGIASSFGLGSESIVLDPGIGFGKTVEHNLELIANLRRFKLFGMPLLVGVSRKSFIGKILDLTVDERLEGSIASAAIAVQQGANIVRVHDVKENVRALRIVNAIMKC
ncbi:MAG: dihydropteroate synthase [Candidatus Eisenbacteria bacterium]|nr:dihydropteroate synthase [Candidatus Eisenbacteria bacterium]